jgi:23S rRNA (guanine745-N1)-methyltransferase
VRDCGLLLEGRGRTMTCARGHSFDVARSGYINLLQPQDRRSLAAGDTREAIEARARLLAAGIGRSVLDAVVDRAVASVSAHDVVADLGSGAGDLLASICRRAAIVGVGIDLSTAAAEYAARHHPGPTWVAANADRRLPLLDRSVDLVLSLHGRRNPGECSRVLTGAGSLIVAVPAADDLIELRAQVQGRGVARERSESLVAEHARYFKVVDRFEIRDRVRLDRGRLRDLLRGTYRGARASAAARLETLDALDVTLASAVVQFKLTG